MIPENEDDRADRFTWKPGHLSWDRRQRSGRTQTSITVSARRLASQIQRKVRKDG